MSAYAAPYRKFHRTCSKGVSAAKKVCKGLRSFTGGGFLAFCKKSQLHMPFQLLRTVVVPFLVMDSGCGRSGIFIVVFIGMVLSLGV